MAKKEDKKDNSKKKDDSQKTAKAQPKPESKKSDKRGDKVEATSLRTSDYKTSRNIPYQTVIVSCACGAEFEAGSTQEVVRVDICSACHPFFTGEKKILDAEGRVEKFKKRYAAVSK